MSTPLLIFTGRKFYDILVEDDIFQSSTQKEKIGYKDLKIKDEVQVKQFIKMIKDKRKQILTKFKLYDISCEDNCLIISGKLNILKYKIHSYLFS